MGSRASRKRQQRLAFSPLPSSSPAAKDYNQQIQNRAAAVTIQGSSSSAKRRKISPNDLGEGQVDGAQDAMPTPSTTSPLADSDSQEDTGPIRPSQRRLTSKNRPRQQQIDFSRARDSDSFDPPVKLASSMREPQSSARTGIFSSQAQRPIADVSSDESDELPSPRKLVSKRLSKAPENSKVRITRAATSAKEPITVDSGSEDDNIIIANQQSGGIEEESDDDDEEMPTTAGRQAGKRAKLRSSFIGSPTPEVIDDDSELEIIDQPRRRRRRSETDEDDEHRPVTPQLRLKRSKQFTQREQDELAEDLEDLEPSSDVERSARKSRATQSAKKSAKQKALEQLKRRRSGHLEEPQDEAEVVKIDDSEEDANEGFSETEIEEPAPMSSRQFFRADEQDEDFLDDDDDEDALLGVPADIPLEFTHFASKKPKELFKHAVEWMVQKKINPGFQRTDSLYGLTFRKLDDEVRGLKDSKFISSVWTPDFTRSLSALPEIAFEPFDRDAPEHYMERDRCDACNRTNHPATFQVQFQGRPYHPDTLEDVAQGDEDDDDDSEGEGKNMDSHPTYDYADRQVPPANRIYYVGKFCMSNARTAHALAHWRHHLNDWVITWLDRHGYTAPQKVVRRDKLSTAKREKEANKIVDRMEQDGVVKELYQGFKQNTEDARNSKQGRYRADSP